MISINALPVTEILSSAIVPVTLITGVAFLTSIMAPRFGRCIDRIRSILAKIKSLPSQSAEHQNHIKQLEILYKRTVILRNTMTAAGFCILFVVLTIAATFSHLIFGFPGTLLSVISFLLSLICLVLITAGFIFDFLNSLNAVKLEIECDLAEPNIKTH